MQILGIETSCDDTGAAVYDTDAGLKSHSLASQVELHALYGGVVPELAARDHVKLLMPLVQKVLQEAEVHKGGIEGVAYTCLLYTSPSPRDRQKSRMPSSA